MFWLSEERPYSRKVGVILSVILTISYAFANYSSNDKILRIMENYGLVFGWFGYILISVFSAAFSFLIFLFVLRMAYGIGMRTISRSKDKRLPIGIATFCNHAYFVMSIANAIIGAIGVIMLDYELYSNIVNVTLRIIVKASAYIALIFLSKNENRFDDGFTAKMFGGFGMVFAAMAVLGV